MANQNFKKILTGLSLISALSIPAISTCSKSNPVTTYPYNHFSVTLEDENGRTNYVHEEKKTKILDIVEQIRPESTSFYYDGSSYGPYDGLVDRVWFLRHAEPVFGFDLLRQKDYSDNPEIFNEADRILAETKERVKDAGFDF